ncbi:Uncharacterised protein [uncultured Ruminococcus sp.]|uniref:GIY-YIG nuclease family protein n=1 Tax=Massiliimalia timonensis TaxID=1987501 RepID=A0A8J6PCN5_9FIRM|nr:GIY-YIG nuclease family protein [Massiliimalia timonensis]MBC8610066.1 GIY-YIG nuclease family protein [Massiliimalia timonensis]SCH11997.1 Uncharacterised protein [uncultured Ruminococcus sp.]SCH79722.1 Uncharacterised protein [uncultured Clostridium sp.]
MVRGKTIRQFLIDGITTGRWVSELSNWTGKAYKIPRTYINKCDDRKDLNNTGVYFLFGVNDDTDSQQVYIGEAENVLNRIKKHVVEKEFWNECVIFISKDNNLNKAHIKYLENHLYILAKNSNRYEILNSNIPTESSISEMDRAEMDEFIDNMRLILSVLGHKVLETPIDDTLKKKSEPVFCIQGRTGTKAKGKLTAEGFVVLKGSTISKEVASSLSPSILNKRQQLIDRGIINGQLEFTQNWIFTSPSLAAGIIMGYSINGRTAWKNSKGISLKDLELQAQHLQ